MTKPDYLKAFPNIRPALVSDNKKILEFSKTINMSNGSLSLRYNREPNFFSFLKVQGKASLVYLLLDKDLISIKGFAVITIRSAYVSQKIVDIAYLSDLRIAPQLNKKIRLQWKGLYNLLLQSYADIKELSNVKHFYTVILSKNNAALNSLAKKKSTIQYNLISSYDSCHIVAKIPLVGFFNKKIFTVKSASSDDKEELLNFLNAQNKNKLFGYPFENSNQEKDTEFSFREKYWPNWKVESFLIIRDKNNTIISCVAPTPSSSFRSIWVEKISFFQKILSVLIKPFNSNSIKESQEFKILYLTTLEFCSSTTEDTKQKLLIAFLDYIYAKKIASPFHIVQFSNWKGQTLNKNLLAKSYIQNATAANFYETLHKDNLENSIVESSHLKPISFELFSA